MTSPLTYLDNQAAAIASLEAIYRTRAAQRLGDLRSTYWKASRAQDLRARVEAARLLEALCETYRNDWHPDAIEVWVSCDHERGETLSVWARFADGVREVTP